MFPQDQARDGHEDTTETKVLPNVDAPLTPKSEIETCTPTEFDDPVEGTIPTGEALIERYQNPQKA